MKHKHTNFEAVVFGAIVLVTASAMVVAGIKGIAGSGRFPYWHLPTLAIFIAFFEASLRPEDKARFAAIVRMLRMKYVLYATNASRALGTKAAKAYSNISQRAVRGLSALFIFRPEDRPQTEP